MKYLISALLAGGIFHSAFSQERPTVYAQLETLYQQDGFEACVAMEKQVERFVKDRVDTLAANSLFYLGDAFNQTGNPDKAILFFEREKSILRILGMTNTEDLSNSLNNLAWLYLQNGNYVRAGMAADELLANDRKLYPPTDEMYVESVLAIADIYLQLDRFADAEKMLLHAARAQERNSLNRGRLLNKLGDLYSYTGEYSKASNHLLTSLDIAAAQAGESSMEYTNTAINLGILYMNQGKYPEAEEIFDVALSQLPAEEPAYASLLNNQALVLQSLGQLDRAERNLQQIRILDSLEVGATHPNFAITLSNLGLLFADQGRFAEAEQALRQALRIQKENQEANTLSYARKLNNLAKVLQMAGSPDKAVPLLEEALSIFKKIMGRNSPEYGTAAHNLGVACWRSGKEETGYKYLRIGSDIRKKILGTNHPRYAESQLKIAEYLWHKKRPREARQSFHDVFKNYYFQLDETFPVLTEEEKSKFYYTQIRDAFDKFNSFAISQRAEQPDIIGDVYNYLINTKAAIMLATEKVKMSIFASGDSSLIRKYEEWQASRERIAKLYSLNQDPSRLDSLLQTANILEKELARRSSTFQDQFVRERYAWQDVQRNLKSGEAAIEVLRLKNYNPEAGGHFSDEVRYGFLVLTSQTKDRPALILLNKGNDMETKFLNYYRNNIRYKLPDVHSYGNFFGSLADYLREAKIRRIYFSPDGVYNQINLNSLQNPESGKYVIDEYDVHMVTNTRELIDVPASQGEPGRSLLMGYPKYNLDTVDDAQPPSTIRGPGLNRTWRGGLLRYMRGEEGISMLPGTAVEIEKIAEIFEGYSSTHTGESASEGIAKEADNPRILHIATHGYFLEDAVAEANNSTYIASPLLNAGLILAGAENFLRTGMPINEQGDDGILTAYEAMNLRLDRTELVVLSACETALGNVVNGEGVYGLQRAFKLAGARNVVMSLWNVDDEATQELMTSFYNEMLETGDRHLAFKAAQQKVKEKYPSPFYWGAFIMVGI